MKHDLFILLLLSSVNSVTHWVHLARKFPTSRRANSGM